MSDSAGPPSDSPAVDDGAKVECDQNSSKLFNKARFSDLVIKFSDRQIYAHRFILCQSSAYFEKLCGPDSPFAEANKHEITLHDDDPDALEAMLRHLYNFWLRPPSLSLAIPEKVHFYCQVVVISDKYDLPALTDEARKCLNTFVVSLEQPELVVESLKIITESYSDYSSLDDCAVNLASSRLKELASIPDFSGWLGSQPKFLQPIVEDAAKLRSLTGLPQAKYKTITKFKCSKADCKRMLVAHPDSAWPIPKCHGAPAVEDGVMYYQSP